MKKSISLLILLSLVFMFVFCLTSCAVNRVSDDLWETAVYTEDTQLGSGAKEISLTVKTEEKTVVIAVNTDKEYLGDALTEHNLIQGEKSVYGLYVKKVNGITADYSKDQTFWELSKNGEVLSTGVDGEKITSGDSYMFEHIKEITE